MNNTFEILRDTLLFGFILLGAVGVPAVLLIFVQMIIGAEDRIHLPPRR